MLRRKMYDYLLQWKNQPKEKKKPLVIKGARQVGKTTMLKHDNDKINYITLDYPHIRILAKEDPELFLQQYKAPLIIDEIQYAPELLSYIKRTLIFNVLFGGEYRNRTDESEFCRLVPYRLANSP